MTIENKMWTVFAFGDQMYLHNSKRHLPYFNNHLKVYTLHLYVQIDIDVIWYLLITLYWFLPTFWGKCWTLSDTKNKGHKVLVGDISGPVNIFLLKASKAATNNTQLELNRVVGRFHGFWNMFFCKYHSRIWTNLIFCKRIERMNV